MINVLIARDLGKLKKTDSLILFLRFVTIFMEKGGKLLTQDSLIMKNVYSYLNTFVQLVITCNNDEKRIREYRKFCIP